MENPPAPMWKILAANPGSNSFIQDAMATCLTDAPLLLEFVRFGLSSGTCSRSAASTTVLFDDRFRGALERVAQTMDGGDFLHLVDELARLGLGVPWLRNRVSADIDGVPCQATADAIVASGDPFLGTQLPFGLVLAATRRAINRHALLLSAVVTSTTLLPRPILALIAGMLCGDLDASTAAVARMEPELPYNPDADLRVNDFYRDWLRPLADFARQPFGDVCRQVSALMARQDPGGAVHASEKVVAAVVAVCVSGKLGTLPTDTAIADVWVLLAAVLASGVSAAHPCIQHVPWHMVTKAMSLAQSRFVDDADGADGDDAVR